MEEGTIGHGAVEEGASGGGGTEEVAIGGGEAEGAIGLGAAEGPIGRGAAQGPVEMSIEREEQYRRGYQLAAVRFGDQIIETVHVEREKIASDWVRYMARNYRKRRAPLVAGLAAYDGHPDYYPRGRATPPVLPYPVCALALCLGGSHVLIYQPVYYPAALAVFPRALRELLEDRRMTVVAIGTARLAEKLERECQVRLGRPAELRSLVATAFGWETAYHLKAGTRPVLKGRSLEEMAEAVVTGGRMVGKKPARLADALWMNDLTDEQLMHATVDALLCFEIGAKCMKATGQPI